MTLGSDAQARCYPGGEIRRSVGRGNNRRRLSENASSDDKHSAETGRGPREPGASGILPDRRRLTLQRRRRLER
jgi:hypothetical protein